MDKIKNYKRLTFSLTPEIEKQLKDAAAKTGLKLSTIVAQAIENFLKNIK